ncbi:signal peptidase I [Hyunsoonleella rubra]|uniref:Signal peptidase I n=1 Tax=Hyunsoonleella rubra TaxID=1737062 RepID=A0ABW5TDD8_9FLAO
MTLTQWLIFLLIIQIIHGLGTWKLYQKAGRQAWETFVPIYNGMVLMKIINRPWWWIILMFLPIVNLIMLIVVWVETARSFGKNTHLDTFLAIASLGFYNYYLNYVADVSYVENRSLQPKSGSGEWTSSILFAIVAATIVHTYFMQPFTIPSSSLEKSLLVGDFLFVSKFHYGARVPMTTVGAPMVHDTIPLLKKKSYLFNDHFEKRNTSWINKLQLPYMRIPGFEDIERNEIVVFNQPADTLLDMNDFHPDRNYYKPIDKKTNLVKRCVGLPGDSLEVRGGYVYINGKKNELPDRAKLQFSYYVKPKTHQFNPNFLASRYDITDGAYPIDRQFSSYYLPAVSDEALAKFKNHPNVAGTVPNIMEKGERTEDIFPHDPAYNWNRDFFGPLYIPKKGATIDINLEVLPLYKRVITEYEGNSLKVEGNQILINGEVASTYTFKQDYYWMMGDNRHNSIDARAWGFVPFNHVVGKPVFIWMSWDSFGKGINKIRWKRLFTTVHGEGNRTSYFIPFLVILFGWIGYSQWGKRKKTNA